MKTMKKETLLERAKKVQRRKPNLTKNATDEQIELTIKEVGEKILYTIAFLLKLRGNIKT